jgi:hypothetical protein
VAAAGARENARVSEPSFPDLRVFLDQLRRDGDLAVVDAEVDPRLEAAEVHRRVIAAGGPALLFTRVRGSAFPLATNLFGTARRAELAFGRRPARLVRRIVHLEAVHAEVGAAGRVGVLGVDERQGDERPAVLRPAGERGQAVEADVARHHLGHRPAPAPGQPDAQRLEADVAGGPELAGGRRHQRLGQVDEPLDEAARSAAESDLGPARGAEEVGGEREVGAAHLREEERRAPGGDHATVDLSGLEVRVDIGLDDGEVAVAAELVEEGAQVGEGEVVHRESFLPHSPSSGGAGHPGSRPA